jgi:prepilin-type N-terminal cleavage/methylation domain-containing protein
VNKKGFTLIELLVVIAVIGILASVVLVSLNNIRAKSRDVRRVNDIKQIQKMVEFYIDKYKTIPNVYNYGRQNNSPGWWDGWWDLSSNPSGPAGEKFMQFLINGGIASVVPVDPLNTPITNAYPSNVNAGYRYVFYVVPYNYMYQGGPASGQNVYMLAISKFEISSSTTLYSSSCNELWKNIPNAFSGSFAYVLCGTF